MPEGTKQYQLRKYAEATLVSIQSYLQRLTFIYLPTVKGSGNLRLAVQLPDGEDLNEWLAVHGKFCRQHATASPTDLLAGSG